jgi:hypothetical protein
VEVDGGQHQDSEADRIRDSWLTEQRFRILRFWNNEVLSETTAVLERIMAFLPPPLPRPLCSPHPWGSPLRDALAGDQIRSRRICPARG